MTLSQQLDKAYLIIAQKKGLEIEGETWNSQKQSVKADYGFIAI